MAKRVKQLATDLHEYIIFADKLVISDDLIYKSQQVLIPRGARADIIASIYSSYKTLMTKAREVHSALFLALLE